MYLIDLLSKTQTACTDIFCTMTWKEKINIIRGPSITTLNQIKTADFSLKHDKRKMPNSRNWTKFERSVLTNCYIPPSYQQVAMSLEQCQHFPLVCLHHFFLCNPFFYYLKPHLDYNKKYHSSQKTHLKRMS